MDENDRRYVKAIDALLTSVNWAAPTRKEQVSFSHFVKEMQADKELSHHEVLRRAIGGFLDGMAYGNWPD
jgi:hypothetical protein